MIFAAGRRHDAGRTPPRWAQRNRWARHGLGARSHAAALGVIIHIAWASAGWRIETLGTWDDLGLMAMPTWAPATSAGDGQLG